MTERGIAELCLSCAKSIYRTTAPSERYAESVGRLLFGTACAESELRYRRQIGFPIDRLPGAWGLWQTEWAPVSDSIRLLEVSPNLGVRVINWLESNGVEHGWSLMNSEPLTVMNSISRVDALGCLFARLHYLRFPSSVPETLIEQASYWKAKYNTTAGAGTVAGYLAKWRGHGAAVWESLTEKI